MRYNKKMKLVNHNLTMHNNLICKLIFNNKKIFCYYITRINYFAKKNY